MLYEIGLDLKKWNIEGLLSRSMYFLCQINVFESFVFWGFFNPCCLSPFHLCKAAGFRCADATIGLEFWWNSGHIYQGAVR